MATIHPSTPRFSAATGGAYRERDVIETLARGLPGMFDVFHNVDWSAMHKGEQGRGEFDAVVVGPEGHLVILEVKAGDVEETEQSLHKNYGSGQSPKDILFQARRQHSAMLQRLNDEGMRSIHVAHFLVLPDYRLQRGGINFPRERIIDASRMDELCSLVRAAMPQQLLPEPLRPQLLAFLSNEYSVFPDASTMVGQTQRISTALSDGLATWVPRIHHASGVYVVEATAGSGKTQLALSLLRLAQQKGHRAAYICYNRSLADHMRQSVPAIVEVETFHEYCVAFSRKLGREPDFSNKAVFDQVGTCLIENAEKQLARLDLLIVDEAQDMEPAWVQALTQRLKPDSALYVLGDSNQRVYDREAFDLSDAVMVTCMDNFRCSRNIVETINALRLSALPVNPKAAHKGLPPGTHVAGATADSSRKAVESCVAALLQDGFAADEIAVVTFAGRERSQILGRRSLGGLSTREPSGKYDNAGNAVWTEGELLIDTLYRFKGQSAPAVVLCEVDFEQIGDKELRKLFVGFTRAQIRLECVLTERAEKLLVDRLTAAQAS